MTEPFPITAAPDATEAPNSAELLAAADAADKLLAGFAGLATLAPAWRKLGSLEGAAKEAEGKVASTKAETERMLEERAASVGKVEKDIADAQGRLAQAETAARNAGAKAQGITADARIDAAKIVDAAGTRAKNMLDEASAEAEKIVANAKRDAAPYEQKLRAAEALLATAEAALAEAQTRKGKVEAEIARLRNLFAGAAPG